MNIGMVGMGFVGGTTAKILSKAHNIFPYDRYKKPYNNQENIVELARNSEVAFICVPTPMKPSGEIDYEPMSYSLNLLSGAVKQIGRNPEEILVTIRSTAISGTTDSFSNHYPFRFAFNPEFLREKSALEDMLKTKRIVIGVETPEDEQKLRRVYEPLFPDAAYIVVDRKTAEMIKYAANATLASQIMIANDIYRICRALGINYDLVKKVMQLDERIGRNMDVPGNDGDFGFGGKCFPKDLCALIHLAREYLVEPHVLAEVWRSNLEAREKKDWLGIPGATSSNKDFT